MEGHVAGAQEWPELAVGLAEMARDLLAQESLQATLDRIAFHAVALVDGCDAAGIMVLEDDRVRTVAASDNVVHASDRIQGELGEGPCFDATRNKSEAYRIADFSTQERRWPRYVPEARQLGIGSMMGFLLYTHDETNLGALNLYGAKDGVFTEQSEQIGWLLASHAAVAMATAEHVGHLRIAMESRTRIGEAVGILMHRYRLSDEDAFARLVKASQAGNRKLRAVAEDIVHTGDLPDGL
jgi:transcriptional regulator with GAF, ATPase, and Fis domain